ncbi:transcriptional regulator [Flavobacterium sp. SM2513]|uniref:transcriptional regulator n=1 Tax=Flavobacterium sp. SM2513 TaxID=3424766 RepID=UPI003D7F53D9
MKAVLTGDIIKSRGTAPELWLYALKDLLGNYGKSPYDWEVFRGDSFQISVPPSQAFFVAFVLKAGMKQIKNVDVRIAIGIGVVDYQAEKITESNGSAFVNSGTTFENLKKQTLAIKTPWQDLDFTLNMALDLATLTMDRWTEKSAQIMVMKLLNPDINQLEIAEKLKMKSQGNISEALKRAGYDEINQLLIYFETKIKELC